MNISSVQFHYIKILFKCYTTYIIKPYIAKYIAKPYMPKYIANAPYNKSHLESTKW